MTTEQLPYANLFDIPELMPGAQPSANPAQRTEFEERCKQLHHEEESASRLDSRGVLARSTGSATIDELIGMFPSLDPDLVRVLASEGPTPQHAMETLLALVAASSEPTVPPPPPKDLPLSDMGAFPSLTDSEGWQVMSQTQFEKDPDEELGSAWRDRAKAVASKPGPPSANTSAVVGSTSKRRSSKDKEDGYTAEVLPETDYDFRQRRGQQRAKNRALFGRGGKGIGKGVGRRNADDESQDESEDEEEEPLP